MVEQALQRRGAEEERHVERAAQHGDRHVDVGDAGQHIGDEVHIVEGAGVARLGQLVVGSAVDIVEDGPGKPPAGELAEILDIVAILKAHGTHG